MKSAFEWTQEAVEFEIGTGSGVLLSEFERVIQKIQDDAQTQLKAENTRLANEHFKTHDWNSKLVSEHYKLKAENARLAAAISKKDECIKACQLWMTDAPVKYTVMLHVALSATPTTALRDLLAPTVELLSTCETLARASKAHDLALECDEELSRLTALIEGKV